MATAASTPARKRLLNVACPPRLPEEQDEHNSTAVARTLSSRGQENRPPLQCSAVVPAASLAASLKASLKRSAPPTARPAAVGAPAAPAPVCPSQPPSLRDQDQAQTASATLSPQGLQHAAPSPERAGAPGVSTLGPAPPALAIVPDTARAPELPASAASSAAGVALTSEQKRRYNGLVLAAKDAEARGDRAQAVAHLAQAQRLCPAMPALARRLARLEAQIADDHALSAVCEPQADGWRRHPSGAHYELPAPTEACPSATAAGTIAGAPLRVPGATYERLLPHQRAGVRWLWQLHWAAGPCAGGVLADDMGLGKTVQVAVYLAALFRARLCRTVLLVVPLAVLENWRAELAAWGDGALHVRLFHGAKGPRERELAAALAEGGVCLSTYGLLRTEAERLAGGTGAGPGAAHSWEYVVLDEGHKIKNPAIKLSRALPAVAARRRLVLTGSPIQNNLQELWALFDYVSQGRLLGDAAAFARAWEAPIVQAHDRAATPDQLRTGQRLAAQLRALIAPFFLRREKKEVFAPSAAAPAAAPTSMELRCRKNDFIVWLPPSEAQVALYRAFLSTDHVAAALNRTQSPLAAITVLKKICDHPRLLHQDMASLAELRLPDFGPAPLDAAADRALVEQSSKLAFLARLLPELHRGDHRVLIFSQSRRMLDLVQALIVSLALPFSRLDGSVASVAERQRLIDQFNGDRRLRVFLLTTGVGGLGINLTSADRAVIFDPAWSPIDDQAVDRVYRIGQTRDVVVYRLITCGTIEEKIYRKQVFKGSLSRTMLAPAQPDAPHLALDPASALALPSASPRYFTGQELRELFRLDDTSRSPTQEQLAALHAHRRVSDPALDAHLAFLHTLGICGLSDHDLLFAGPHQPHPPAPGATTSPRLPRPASPAGDVRDAEDLGALNNSHLWEEGGGAGEEKPTAEEKEEAQALGPPPAPAAFAVARPATALATAAAVGEYNALVEAARDSAASKAALRALQLCLRALAVCDEDLALHAMALRLADRLHLVPARP